MSFLNCRIFQILYVKLHEGSGRDLGENDLKCFLKSFSFFLGLFCRILCVCVCVHIYSAVDTVANDWMCRPALGKSGTKQANNPSKHVVTVAVKERHVAK